MLAEDPVNKYSKWWLCYFSIKPYGVTIHSNRLGETIRMSGHTIAFSWALTKHFCIHPFLCISELCCRLFFTAENIRF